MPETNVQDRVLSEAEWVDEGSRRFGPDKRAWRFVCPACGHVACVQDWIDAGATPLQAAFSCVGRYLKRRARDAFARGPGPCNYAGGGLFGLNPVKVRTQSGKIERVFAFAEEVL